MYKIWYIDFYVLPLHCLSKTERKGNNKGDGVNNAILHILNGKVNPSLSIFQIISKRKIENNNEIE